MSKVKSSLDIPVTNRFYLYDTFVLPKGHNPELTEIPKCTKRFNFKVCDSY